MQLLMSENEVQTAVTEVMIFLKKFCTELLMEGGK